MKRRDDDEMHALFLMQICKYACVSDVNGHDEFRNVLFI
jgi:hypothetical protein